MEDLFPLVIFLVIVGVNVFKFFAEKGKAQPTQEEGQSPVQKRPSVLESFFENLAEQMAPRPTELPPWPEGRERPNYLHEREEVKEEEITESYFDEAPESLVPKKTNPPGHTPPSIQMAQRYGFQIKSKNALKQAMIAHIIFSPPKAFDLAANPPAKHK